MDFGHDQELLDGYRATINTGNLKSSCIPDFTETDIQILHICTYIHLCLFLFVCVNCVYQLSQNA